MAKILTPSEYFAQTGQQSSKPKATGAKQLSPQEYFKQTGQQAPKTEVKPFPRVTPPPTQSSRPIDMPSAKIPDPMAKPYGPPAPTTVDLANAYKQTAGRGGQGATAPASNGTRYRFSVTDPETGRSFGGTMNGADPVPLEWRNNISLRKVKEPDLLDKVVEYGGIAASGLRRGLENAGASLGELYDMLIPSEVVFGEDNALDKAFKSVKNTNQVAQAHFDAKLDTTGKKIFGTIMQGTGDAIPQALMAMATAGGSLAAQGTQRAMLAAQNTAPALVSAVQKLATNPSFLYSYSRTATSTYNKELEQGATPAQAAASGVINGALSAIVEVGGGLEGFDRQLPTLKAILKSALEEGQEEVFQYTIENLVNKAVGSDTSKWFSTTPGEDAVINPLEQLKQGAYGAAVGGILGGGQP